MGLRIHRPNAFGRTLVTLIAIFALVAQPLYGVIASHVVAADTPVSGPTLQAPAHNSAFRTSDLPVRQAWSEVTGATSYVYASYTVNPETNPDAEPAHTQTITRTHRNIGATASEGTYWWRVQAVTSQGTSGWSAVRTFTVDNTAPVVDSITLGDGVTPVEGAVVSGTQKFIAHITENDGPYQRPSYTLVEIWDEEGASWLWGPDKTPQLPGTTKHGTTPALEVNTNHTDLPDGAYTLRVRGADFAGNEFSKDVAFTIDNTAPALQVNGSTDSGRYFGLGRVGIAAPDDDLDRIVIEQKRDNGEFTHRQTYTKGVNFSTTANISWLGDGVYRIQAFDIAGNTSERIEFTIDTADPIISGVSVDRTLTNQNTLTVSGTVTDANLRDYNVRVYNADRSAVVSPWIGYMGTVNVENGTLANNLNISSLSDGDYWVRVWAHDLADNHTGISPHIYVPFTVDRTAPGVPSVTSGNATTVSGAAEAGSTVAVFVGGEQVGTTTASSSGNWSLTFETALEPGTHNVTVRATDRAGNTSASSAGLAVLVSAAETPAIITPATPQPEGPIVINDDDEDSLPTQVSNAATLPQLFAAPQTVNNDTDDEEVLGDEDTLGAQTNRPAEQAAVTATENGWSVFGLLWYWWVLILAAIAAAGWWLLAALRRRREAEDV